MRRRKRRKEQSFTPTSNVDELAGSFRFTLTFQTDKGKEVTSGFSEVTGLAATVTTETIKEGGVNGFAIQLPLATTYPNLQLRRGIVDTDFLEWVLQYRETGMITKRNITVSLLGRGETDEVVREWKFRNAYPIKWNGPSLNASSSALAVEGVEFVHEGIAL